MENIQKKYEELFKHSCYCFCLCYTFAENKNEWNWLQMIAEAIQLGFIKEDCYVAKPLKFISLISDHNFRDVQKVTINSMWDIPKVPTICEMQQPNGKDSHFVVCHFDGEKVVLDFDPSGISNSWNLGKFKTYRKFV